MAVRIDELKCRILDYIERKNIEINTRKTPPVMRCVNPGHEDNRPSAIIYDDKVFCPVCDKTWDIFDIAGMIIGTSDFNEQKKEVLSVLGESDIVQPDLIKIKSKKDKPEHKKSEHKKKEHPNIVPVPPKEAKELFSRKMFEERAELNHWGVVVGAWFYRDVNNMIDLVDVRFEKDGTKSIISFYYDGVAVRSKNYPVLLYNRHLLTTYPDKPILIVEGAKTAEAARVLNNFNTLTWNGGCKKILMADWAPLINKKVFIFPDDDGPGVDAANELKASALPNAIIVPIIPKLREIKKKGADIVEALQKFTPEELTKYILESEKLQKEIAEKSKFPFRILGTSDDGNAYFLDRSDRLQKFKLTSVTKTQLMSLASRDWWIDEIGHDRKIVWDEAIDLIIELSSAVDFDPDRIRGRGAWRELNGELVYNDGKTITGSYNSNNLYLRKTQTDVGIAEKPLDYETINKIRETVFELSFESMPDAIRCLAWSTLAPFGGCLSWRPAILLTGASGSGKTTVANNVIRPIANPLWLDGSESTPAGVRGSVQNDTCSIVLEEADCDTLKKRNNRIDLFSLMRTNTSDDAPDTAKGTSDGGVRSYKMKNMFCFIAISPEIDNVADENRIFKINMKKPKGKWQPLQNRLTEIMVEKNCRALRSLIWSKLNDIMDGAKQLIPVIQEITEKDFRFCQAEGLLMSAYFNIWTDIDINDAETIKQKLTSLYKMQPLESSRDETDEMLDRIMDESVIVNGMSDVRTLREILISIYNAKELKKNTWNDSYSYQTMDAKDITRLRQIVHRFGIDVTSDSEIAISCNHHELMRILEKGYGYHLQLRRHKNMTDKAKSVYIAGKTRRCVTIAYDFVLKEIEDTESDTAEF